VHVVFHGEPWSETRIERFETPEVFAGLPGFGAAAITRSGVPVQRSAIARLLGFRDEDVVVLPPDVRDAQ
jgi:hypothetical protein